jgi:glycosyltransferase involved in cell wall biosynthesis
VTRPLRVLILSYYAPPCGGPGVQRVENLLRYAPPGVEAVVLAAALRDYEALSPLRMPVDPTRSAPEEAIHRVPAGLPDRLFRALARCRLYGAVRWLYLPDVARSWGRRVVEVAARLHRETPFDAIFSTAPPFSVALAGRDCARRLRLPWVSDLQDLWTGYLLGAWPTPLHYRRELALERTVVAEATVTVMVTPGSRRKLLERHPSLSPDRVACVTYGYCAEDFPPAPAPAAPGKLVVVHTGVFFSAFESTAWRRLLYGRSYRPRRVDASTHSPALLVRAMEQVADPRVEFRHIGPMDSETQRLFRTSSVRNRIHALGYRPHAEALAELRRADAAYLCLAADLDGRANELVPQKTYEYLGSRRPVLAPIPDGDARSFLTEAGVGLCTSPYDAECFTRTLRALRDSKFSGRPLVTPREEVIRRFEWSALITRLWALIEQAAGAAQPGRDRQGADSLALRH